MGHMREADMALQIRLLSIVWLERMRRSNFGFAISLSMLGSILENIFREVWDGKNNHDMEKGDF